MPTKLEYVSWGMNTKNPAKFHLRWPRAPQTVCGRNIPPQPYRPGTEPSIDDLCGNCRRLSSL
jgi:hypothetical protein